MTLRLNAATSGFTEIDAPAVAGSNTLVLPGGNGSNGNILGTDGAGNLSWVNGRMVLDTAKASTSGTSVDFTSIPSWVKKITVMFSGVSTNGTSVVLVQLGDSGGIETTGYLGCASINTSLTITAAYTTGFGVTQQTNASDLQFGHIILTNLDLNTWAASVNCARSDSATSHGAGAKTLSGTLDRVRITTVNGTDTFDAGSINILYEG
jgi:hypothetical protein